MLDQHLCPGTEGGIRCGPLLSAPNTAKDGIAAESLAEPAPEDWFVDAGTQRQWMESIRECRFILGDCVLNDKYQNFEGLPSVYRGLGV